MSPAIYEKRHTALLIVDPYNDFMSKGGNLYAITKPTADSVGYYENMRKLIPAVRAAGVQVFIVPHRRTRDDDFARWLHVNPTQADTKKTKAFAVDTWVSEWHPEFGHRPVMLSLTSIGRLGYHVTFINDATVAFNPEGMEAARANSLLYAHAILTTNELSAALPEAADIASCQSCS